MNYCKKIKKMLFFLICIFAAYLKNGTIQQKYQSALSRKNFKMV
jgi:hypothetical protein